MAIKELDLTILPDRMQRLPLDHRGYPIPWFVHIDRAGKPDFRIIGNERGMSKVMFAHTQKRCWICGQPRGRNMTFVIGPMCAISGVTSEPPCHADCATYAAKVCPFLVRPNMHRQEHGMPEDKLVAGVMISRNPGVTALWGTRDYEVFKSNTMVAGTRGVLFNIGQPEWVSWWREGRKATSAEVWASIESGLPSLAAVAIMHGQAAMNDLLESLRSRARLIQPEGTLPSLVSMLMRATKQAPDPEIAQQLQKAAANAGA